MTADSPLSLAEIRSRVQRARDNGELSRFLIPTSALDTPPEEALLDARFFFPLCRASHRELFRVLDLSLGDYLPDCLDQEARSALFDAEHLAMALQLGIDPEQATRGFHYDLLVASAAGNIMARLLELSPVHDLELLANGLGNVQLLQILKERMETPGFAKTRKRWEMARRGYGRNANVAVLPLSYF